MKRAIRFGEPVPVLKHGNFFFEDWMAIDPHDDALEEALHRARYNLAALTQSEAYRILSAAEAYQHFAGHPADDKSILAQLKRLRVAARRAKR